MSLRIVIVGGVAGGMSAATRARRMNESASIVVLEKGGFISFANCGLPYYRPDRGLFPTSQGGSRTSSGCSSRRRSAWPSGSTSTRGWGRS